MHRLTEERSTLTSGAVLLAALGTALLVFLVYLPALKGGFINWDDPLYVYNNPHIRSLDLRLLKEAFSPIGGSNWNWHPLTVLSHALDYKLWGLNPFGHHLTNNILHSVNTALVLLLAIALIDSAAGDDVGGKNPAGHKEQRLRLLAAGIVTALIFGLHPLRVESVAWVSERKDLLCALFYILSVMTYLKYARGADATKSRLLYIASLVLFISS